MPNKLSSSAIKSSSWDGVVKKRNVKIRNLILTENRNNLLDIQNLGLNHFIDSNILMSNYMY